jgi:hypothetical protein
MDMLQRAVIVLDGCLNRIEVTPSNPRNWVLAEKSPCTGADPLVNR